MCYLCFDNKTNTHNLIREYIPTYVVGTCDPDDPFMIFTYYGLKTRNDLIFLGTEK